MPSLQIYHPQLCESDRVVGLVGKFRYLVRLSNDGGRLLNTKAGCPSDANTPPAVLSTTQTNGT